ncbi:DNA pilot protein [Chicken microvirus mg7_14]|nr:DNA pilot protein [Chicken microvirus mg7_14]
MWGPIIAAGISAAGSYLGAQKQASAANAANDKQIAWQREAMQNRHQWEVQDLRKAGLNPILSANAGASTGGAGFHPSVPDYMSAYQNLVGNAVNALKGLAEIENTEQNTRVAYATEKRIDAETHNLGLTGARLGMDLKRDQENPLSYEVGSRSGWPAQFLQGLQSTWNRLGNWYNNFKNSPRPSRPSRTYRTSPRNYRFVFGSYWR